MWISSFIESQQMQYFYGENRATHQRNIHKRMDQGIKIYFIEGQWHMKLYKKAQGLLSL